MKYRVAIITKDGKSIGRNFDNRNEVEDFILKIDDKNGVKRADILNRETKERERLF